VSESELEEIVKAGQTMMLPPEVRTETGENREREREREREYR
jgi:hypothetical protein